MSHRILSRLGAPGVIVHGVVLKPGKPLCLAAVGTTPVVVLPGFPTSAVFTFHEFVALVIRAFAGLPPREETEVEATLAVRTPSELGRTKYVMVSLAAAPGGGLNAFPLGKGSGTRILLDGLLGGARPAGYANQPKSHNAVAAAVAQGRADWGVAIESVARAYGLGFLPLADEHYDFFLAEARADRAAVAAFLRVLESAESRAALAALGFVRAATQA